MTMQPTGNVLDDVRQMLAGFIDIEPDALLLNARLEEAYGMDSTEMTEFAKKLEQRFSISFAKSEREDWLTGNDILRFVEKKMRENGTGIRR